MESSRGWLLKRIGGEEKSKPIILNNGVNKIGRDRNTVSILCISTYVSRIHCDIVVRDGDIFIKDLGSCNGTYLGDTRITSKRSVEVKDGDVISLGLAYFEGAVPKSDHYAFEVVACSLPGDQSISQKRRSSTSPIREPAKRVREASSSQVSSTVTTVVNIDLTDEDHEIDQKPYPERDNHIVVQKEEQCLQTSPGFSNSNRMKTGTDNPVSNSHVQQPHSISAINVFSNDQSDVCLEASDFEQMGEMIGAGVPGSKLLSAFQKIITKKYQVSSKSCTLNSGHVTSNSLSLPVPRRNLSEASTSCDLLVDKKIPIIKDSNEAKDAIINESNNTNAISLGNVTENHSVIKPLQSSDKDRKPNDSAVHNPSTILDSNNEIEISSESLDKQIIPSQGEKLNVCRDFPFNKIPNSPSLSTQSPKSAPSLEERSPLKAAGSALNVHRENKSLPSTTEHTDVSTTVNTPISNDLPFPKLQSLSTINESRGNVIDDSAIPSSSNVAINNQLSKLPTSYTRLETSKDVPDNSFSTFVIPSLDNNSSTPIYDIIKKGKGILRKGVKRLKLQNPEIASNSTIINSNESSKSFLTAERQNSSNSSAEDFCGFQDEPFYSPKSSCNNSNTRPSFLNVVKSPEHDQNKN